MTLPAAAHDAASAEVSSAAPEMSSVSDEVLRVERGRAEPEELAAVTAVLLARAAAHPASTSDARPKPGWRRLEREAGFRGPHSWRG